MRRTTKKDAEAETFDEVASGDHFSQITPPQQDAVERLRFLCSTASDPSRPFEDRNVLWGIVHGTSDGAVYPTLDAVPDGRRAKELREACGLSVEKISRVLTIGRAVLPAIESGQSVFVDETLSWDYGATKGVRKLYGCLQAWLDNIQEKEEN